MTDEAVRFEHDAFQNRRREALIQHGASSVAQLPDELRNNLQSEFCRYSSRVRSHAAYELADILAEEGSDANLVMNASDLDLDQIDYDADAMREIDTIVDRSTTSADLAAALAAGHLSVDAYAERLEEADEVVIDPALLDDDAFEEDDEEDGLSQDSDRESVRVSVGADSDSDEDEDGSLGADEESDRGSDVGAESDSDEDEDPSRGADDLYPLFTSPFPELHELLAGDTSPDFLALYNALIDAPP